MTFFYGKVVKWCKITNNLLIYFSLIYVYLMRKSDFLMIMYLLNNEVLAIMKRMRILS